MNHPLSTLVCSELPSPRQSLQFPIRRQRGLARLKRGAEEQYQTYLKQLQEQHEVDLHEHAERESLRLEAVAAKRRAHEAMIEEEESRLRLQHAEIDSFRDEFQRGEPDAVVEYFGLVLQGSAYPSGFPSDSKVAFVPESRQLVIELDLPGVDIVPRDKAYRFVKAKDEITASPRTASDVKARYASLISQVSLRTIHEIFEADRGRHLDTLVFNGYVDHINAATGRPERVCLISVRTTANVFSELDLQHVDPISCLKALNATVSSKPSELAPVRPILEFSMVDPRYIERTDILGALDRRINLMELSPIEFEGLISNLFERMGLETRQTRASRDGGVDCVAYDPRPIFGGKVVIQAKRYKNTVGVSSVRDLFGTVQNEGASKGILVTTSGFGGASFEFAQGKPLELLDGANLLYLLTEHAGIEAKIEPPEDWRDPIPDAAPALD